VQGNLRLKRIANYDAKDGTWTGAEPTPPEGAAPSYNSAVEKAVAASIEAAMKPFVTGQKPPAEPFHADLPAGWYDPTEENIRAITRDTIGVLQATLQNQSAAAEARGAADADADAGALRVARGGQQLAKRRQVRTEGGCTCSLPFSYGGKAHGSCTRRDSHRAWCYTEGRCGRPSEAGDGHGGAGARTWDYCTPAPVVTVKGCECDLPFEFAGVRMARCVDAARTFLWGAEPAAGKGPRGLWCKTKGDCGEGTFRDARGAEAQWDHCEAPPPRSALVSTSLPRAPRAARARAGPRGRGAEVGAFCGATVADVERHRRAFQFSGACAAGSVCAYRCLDSRYCPSCAGGNCQCVPLKPKGAACGEGSNRPPAYADYQCASGRCLWARDGRDVTCNGGSCRCA